MTSLIVDFGCFRSDSNVVKRKPGSLMWGKTDLKEVPSSNSLGSGEGNEHKTLDIDSLLVMKLIGYSVYIAWVLTLFLSPVLAPYDSYTRDFTVICRVAFLLGVLLFLLLFWKFLKPGNIGICLFFALLSCPLTALLGAANLLVFPMAAKIAIWFSLGCLVVPMIALWSTVFSHLHYDKVGLFISLSILIGIILAMILSIIQYVAVVFAILLPLVSVAFYSRSKGMDEFLQHRHLEEEKLTSRQLRISWRLDCGIMAYCFCIGFACYCTSVQELWPFNILLTFTFAAIASVVCIFDAKKNKILSLTLVHKIFYLLVLFFALPLLFLNRWIFLACCVMAAFFFVFNVVVNLSGIAIGSAVYGFPPIQYACRAKTVNVIALALGYSVAALYYDAIVVSFNPLIVQIVIVLFILLFGIISTFALVNTFPSMDENLESDAKEKHDNVARNKQGWADRCNKFADQHDFSARQREVLKYLSRGRNAPYIATTLFISESTVKSHIYSIFKKSGVHSVQELIDMIEKIEGSQDVRNR